MDVAGIDVGSSAVKVAVVRDTGAAGAELRLGVAERIRRRDPRKLAEELFNSTLADCGLVAGDLGYVATTGDAEELAFRTGHFYGMTTHARGAVFLDPEVRAVIDIGALHARGIRIDARAKVLGSRMTSQCASGSGQFLENICRYLGITLEAIGPLSLLATKPEKCSSICAVLAETDVINMVSRGVPTADIIKGIHESMAGRYLKLLTSLAFEGPALVTGGLASDVGLMNALREAAQAAGGRIEFRSHPRSVPAGAIGAALWGAFRARKLAMKGLALHAGGAA
ncbi:MAG: benzoyl-CoA reductase subunit D [Planctomycetes bacterium]|nr:benzoyl-CoA reductase subunit D [Planctomycetota bacterium]